MKDKIQKLASLNQEVTDLLKEEKMDEVVEKLAEIQVLTKEMDEAVEKQENLEDPTKNAEEIEKQEKINKAVSEIEKYATLNISADSIKNLMDEFAEFKEQMTAGLETMNKVNERLEVVENAKGISKQVDEKINKSSEKDIWAGLPL